MGGALLKGSLRKIIQYPQFVFGGRFNPKFLGLQVFCGFQNYEGLLKFSSALF